ncbi:LutC/YkgG family protein [Auraticoccus monumenti]|uniref:L-lactate dehydrogenase complex protein LldG n=1 Tax=Auraticoccus monumenti TaxID=675864 RepID=A0A1G7D099_9ACTN|nr:LUD domain-containing protein [Auraticoccus monumenti]SDE44941.1 L-lactate dehydrogenase complex protein LldG [Auraticoccus monumenti]
MTTRDAGTAREEVLARVRQAHAAAAPEPWPYEEIDRAYRAPEAATAASFDTEALVELLVDRLLDYKAGVRRCGAGEVGATVAALLAERGARRVVVPPGLDQAWRSAGVEWVVDEPALGVTQLDEADAVVTGSAVAVALTGSIVLDASPDQGRRAISLVPDHHVCVVAVDDVVHGVGEALTRLNTTRPLTWISGPSATSDIELDRVEGVHGPRLLDVVVVA